MDLRTFEVLAQYNERTNREMNGLIRTLDLTRWNREFGGYFKSIESLCNHIYVCDFNWLKRFSRLREFDCIRSPFFAADIGFGATVLNGPGEYDAKRGDLDDRITAFVREIRQSDINQMLTYTDSRGTVYERVFGGLVLHMFNHQTHHRGMISIYLENMGISNDYSNLSNML
jgi:uncharacterized damage-inducible protein DinB